MRPLSPPAPLGQNIEIAPGSSSKDGAEACALNTTSPTGAGCQEVCRVLTQLNHEPPSKGAPLSYDLRQAYAFRLSQFYSPAQGGIEEHPVYTDEEWCLAVEEPVGLREYWCWVAASIEADLAMWPWDREVSASVLVSRAARIVIEYVDGAGWVAKGEGASLIRHTPAPTEVQAWTTAARAVLALPYLRESPGLAIAEDTPITELVYRISSRLALILQPLHDSTVSSNFAEGGMRAFERTNSQWVRLCRAAGVEIRRTEAGYWAVVKGPDIEELRCLQECRNEAETWRAAAEAVTRHMLPSIELTEEAWRQKAPSQRVELVHAFYADFRPSAPDEASAQHLAHEAKLLCLGLGWKVSRNRAAPTQRAPVWELNRDGKFSSEAAAWLAGADNIRQQVMQKTNIAFVDWANLTVDDRILLAQEHLI